MKPRLPIRLAIAIGAGCVAGLLLWLRFHAEGAYDWALDFTWFWRGSDAFRRGVSPYVAINAFSNGYPCCDAGYLVPFPAAIIFLPFAYLPAQAAAVIAEGLFVFVFAFALMKDGYWRLPLLLSYPLIFNALSGQVVPLMTAAFLLPALGVFACLKFTHGFVGWLYNLSWTYLIGAWAVIIVSAVIWPWWPTQFWNERHDTMGSYWHAPILVAGGFLALLALIRWRDKDARLVAAFACMPQTMLYYDQLPLLLIARNYRESLIAAVFSWLAPAIAIAWRGNAPVDREILFAQTGPIIVWCYYIPAAAFVIFRKPQEAR